MMTLTVLLAALAAPAADVSCTYPSVSRQELHSVRDCAVLQAGQPVLRPAVLSDLQVDESEGSLGPVHLNQAWHWVRPDGAMQAVLTFDNGPDPFVEGLTRGPGTTGMAYYDQQLQRVLDTPYAWVLPFQNGRALVCADCVTSAQGEHRELLGNTWGVIDQTGKVLVVPTLTREAASGRL